MFVTYLDKLPNTDDYDTHQLLWSLFEDRTQSRPFCFQLFGNKIVMFSSARPKVKSESVRIANNNTLMFTVVACPPDRKTRSGNFRAENYSADHLKKWFVRVFEESAKINFVSYNKLPPKSVKNNKGNKMVWAQYNFFGSLTVIDAEKFEKRIATGFGQGAGFGLGLMVLRDVIDI